ncbi:hypothetical protein [Veronia pacifica]|uniref:Uncharacterized protein n=2 Tax=Veronia pacifica TaxID=1080227 RepID=A0A1C3EMR0_9GAMM|nr:hypothetical protein A8L45_05990 [Veronia pacifica]
MNSDRQNKLKKKMVNYYSGINLTNEQIEELTSPRMEKSRYPMLAYTFASVLLILCVFFFTTKNTLLSVTEEIAYNHKTNMQIEVASESLSEISLHLNRLDFSLINTTFFENDKWRLIGGRYCSIGGKIAAQLKVFNITEQKTYTFYQAKIPSNLNIERERKTLHVDGVDVTLWRENGLLLGLAR